MATLKSTKNKGDEQMVGQADYAIIGGTGVYDSALLEDPKTITINTEFGPSVATIGEYKGKKVAFMPRHGASHSIPPHRINYRANIWALKELGVSQVLASAAVGSLKREYEPGSLVIVDDFLDFTKSRATTFFEASTVIHVDVTDPYCSRLRREIALGGAELGIANIHDGGTYVCTEGPRFESPAEIRMYEALGAHVVGMTSIPEVVLAKEAELCYATVCMVTNYAAGISDTPLTHEEVVHEMNKNVHRIRDLFFHTILRSTGQRECRCKTAVGGQTPLSRNQGGNDV